MARDFSIGICKAVEDFFRKDDWHFEPADENGVIRTSVSLKCKLQSCKIIVIIKNNGFSVLSYVPLNADENCRDNIMEFITRANYGIGYGNFEMDLEDGEVRYKTSLLCADTIPDFEQVRGMVYLNVSTLNQYGDGLAKLMFGYGSAKEAIEECEKD